MLHFDFQADKANNSIYVTRAFDGPLPLVWDAWTKPEHLDQWWAPKPYRTVTKSMDFREGGRWLYAMYSPENQSHWCRADYKTVDPLKSYAALDSFCDENGNAEHEFPGSLWNNTFTETNGQTTVNISIQYKSLEDLEKIIELGFREGFSMAMGNLDELLLALPK